MKGLIPATKLFWKKHGSDVLVWTGAIGVIATAVSAASATPKAMKLLEKEEATKGEKLTAVEKVKTLAPAYIPTAMVAAATIGCIFGANVLNKRQQAAMATLYSMADNAYKQYQAKVKESLGSEADLKIKRAIANDRLECAGAPVCGGDEKIFMDFYSLQIFSSTMERVRVAANVVNDLIQTRGYAFVSDFYTALGIPSIDDDCSVGWSKATLAADNVSRFEVMCEQSTAESGDDYYLMLMSSDPVPDCYF